MHRLPRPGLVYWRKIIAGRTLIAARIYRGFWTNGNGFLRGIRIGFILGVPASSAYFARIGMGRSSLRALQTFSLCVRPEIVPQLNDLSHVGGLRKTQAAQASRKLRARGP
ncbi:hypothetical protein [Rhizobium leguminosarum]|uniref:hypothetical protein n=1 Tax=Rhizobium leguminosarum TaxID=384 RepID=UPI001C924539|nr:hypothetical protein [Rhizobium leguminosarum]MBY2910935.1 hypothetical protein [Rhizobium leguminosarum]